MDLLTSAALGLGAAWASGLNVYAVALTLGLLDAAGWIDLPPHLEPLSSSTVLAVAAIMYVVEFVADKVPGLDHVWDVIHTFIRIPAGAIIAAAAFVDVDPQLAAAAALVGGTLAAGGHLTKLSTRTAVNLSPEPVSTALVSLFEDALAFMTTLVAVFFPALALIGLVLIVAGTIWLLPKLLRLFARLVARVTRWLRGTPPPADEPFSRRS